MRFILKLYGVFFQRVQIFVHQCKCVLSHICRSFIHHMVILIPSIRKAIFIQVLFFKHPLSIWSSKGMRRKSVDRCSPHWASTSKRSVFRPLFALQCLVHPKWPWLALRQPRPARQDAARSTEASKWPCLGGEVFSQVQKMFVTRSKLATNSDALCYVGSFCYQ